MPPERPQAAQDASPQTGKGHGHTEVSNELLEAVYAFPFTGPQVRMVLFIIRDSYGWKRKVTLGRTIREMAEAVNLPRSSADRALRELVGLSVVDYDADSGGLTLVKNYNAWGATPQLPLELSTGGDKPVDNFASTIGVPLADCPTGGTKSCPTGGQNLPTGGTKNPASGTHIGEIKVKKERKGADPQLPNQKNDTPRNRAALGHEDFAPEDHVEFKRLSFKLQDELTATWKESREAARKAAACRNGCGRPRASEAWPYCRPCTVCHVCDGGADGTRKFHSGGGGVICTACADKIK